MSVYFIVKELHLKKVLGLALSTFYHHIPHSDHVLGDESEVSSIFELGVPLISYSSSVPHEIVGENHNRKHYTLMDLFVLLTLSENGSFSHSVDSGLGCALFFELLLRDLVSISAPTKPTLTSNYDCIIKKVERNAPHTNIPIIDEAVLNLLSWVTPGKTKSVDIIRSLSGHSLVERFKDINSRCVQRAINLGLLTGVSVTGCGVHSPENYQLTQLGKEVQSTTLQMIRNFVMYGITPEDTRDFSLALIFYAMDWHQHSFIFTPHSVRTDLVVDNKTDQMKAVRGKMQKYLQGGQGQVKEHRL